MEVRKFWPSISRCLTLTWPTIAWKPDVDFVPLVFQPAQGAFVAFTQVTQRRRGGDKGVDVLARRRGAFHGRADQFPLLHHNGFDFQKLVLILGGKFLAARQADEMIEELPAFQIVFELGDQAGPIFYFA